MLGGGRTTRNYFMQQDVNHAVIENLKSKLLYDTRLKDDAIILDAVASFRDKPFSDFNKKLIDSMRTGNINYVNTILNQYYKKFESNAGLLEDEFYDYRIGFELAISVINDISIRKNEIKLCDVACGHGQFLHEISKNKNIIAKGIDLSKDRVDYLQKAGLNASVGTIEQLNEPDDEFDYVCCFECLEHVYNLEGAVGEITRVCKQGGYILITVPYKQKIDFDTHVRLFDENDMLTLFHKEFDILNMILIPYVKGNPLNSLFMYARKRGNGK